MPCGALEQDRELDESVVVQPNHPSSRTVTRMGRFVYSPRAETKTNARKGEGGGGKRRRADRHGKVLVGRDERKCAASCGHAPLPCQTKRSFFVNNRQPRDMLTGCGETSPDVG